MNILKKGAVKTASFDGINVFETTVECHLLPGIPSFTIVGLGDKTISESKERIKSALFSCGFTIPNAKIIINLSPANRNKEGSHYDLPIALSILIAIGEISQNLLENSIIMGELGLSGQILPIHGVLPSVIFAKKNNYNFIGSTSNVNEMILPIQYFVHTNLLDLINSIRLNKYFIPENKITKQNIEINNIFDNIYGQEIGKRALIIAAAGKHNLLFIGSKGVGKTMLSKSIVDLLPDLSEDEILETTSIHSIAGALKNNCLVTKPPFRSPHSSCSLVSLVGGGSIPKPGEISLAHNGVLFLDELPEFNSMVIDSLRTPIEEKLVNIARAKYKIVYPANFQLIVSMNPCKCGNLLKGNCKCKQKNYMYKISAPIQDRIDLKVVLDSVDFSKKPTVSCQLYKTQIQEAVTIQINRFGKRNSYLSIQELEKNGKFSSGIVEKLKQICGLKQMSGRGYLKALSVARTIADLEKSEFVELNHINESIFFVNNEYCNI